MLLLFSVFFFNDTATTEIYTLSLHDALPISPRRRGTWPRRWCSSSSLAGCPTCRAPCFGSCTARAAGDAARRSEEHTSELQSRQYLVCRLLLEKKKII